MAFAENYNDVASRIAEFRKLYPTGSLRQLDLQFLTFGGKDWVVYTAAAYRSPDDACPGIGTAWEPVPGKTPYTRDSEVMVAETSAWGRALIATLAVDSQKGIASTEEIQNRQAPKTPGRDYLAEAGQTKDVVKLRKIYAEARQAKVAQDVLDSIASMANG
jgi:hypothetical protein